MFVSLVRELFGWFVTLLLWTREIAGWICLVLGVLVFYQCFAMLVSTPPRIIQAFFSIPIGFVLFRGGIHLLKVSAAGLICLKAQRAISEGTEAGSQRRSGPAAKTRLRTGPFELGPRMLPR